MADSPSNVHQLETSPTDAEKAKAHTARLIPLLEQACAVMNEIRRDGMAPEFSLSWDGMRNRIVGYDIKKSML